MPNTLMSSARWTTRPVFVSSTFRDMQAERDHLQHVVFPRLEEELRKARIRFESIDLRQGVETVDVPDEAAREQLVLKVCLNEIHRSRPFLIVLLGDRYGWVPSEERMAAAVEEAGIATNLTDKSVTALEIEFGILKQSPEQRRRSFFYFRDPLPYERMPQQLRADYCDEYSSDPDTRRRHRRLNELRQSLADDPELAPRIHRYHADWDDTRQNVVGLEAWGEQVCRHLLEELQVELQAAATRPPQTWDEQERAELREFIEHRRRDFVGRQELLDELAQIATAPAPPDAKSAIADGVTWGACLIGEPGSGKSAIFAELASRFHAQPSLLVLTNAAGGTARGSHVDAMLERFIQELADALGIANPLPEKATPDDVDAAFTSLLNRVAAQKRVVVLIDALNQFDPTIRARHLTWLRSRQWPANARLIATSLPCPASDVLMQSSGIEQRTVPPLRVSDGEQIDDVDAIANAVYGRYHRQTNPAVLRVLRTKRLPDSSLAAGNPLWLTLALEQINLLDADDFTRADRDFAHLPGAAERLRAMLIDMAERMPPSVDELYGWLLAQSEKIFGVAASRSFTALIAVSRFGWRDSDLLSLIPVAARVLCPAQPPVELDSLRLASLRRSFRSHLIRRGTLEQLDFFHQQMRQAVFQRSLTDKSVTRQLHRLIADHLEALPADDSLRVNELMVHLIAGEDSARAARVLADLPVPPGVPTATTQVLAQHILTGTGETRRTRTRWITDLLNEPCLTDAQTSQLANRLIFDVCDPLAATADIETRHSLLSATQITQQRLVNSDPANAVWQHNLSVSFERLGDLESTRANLPEAQRMFGLSHQIRRSLAESDPENTTWQRDLWVSFMKLGDLAATQGNLPEAQQFFGESHRIWQRLAESDSANAERQRDLAVSFHKLGDLALTQGNLSEARRLFGLSQRIAHYLADSNPASADWQRDLYVSFIKLGDLETTQGNLPEAQRNFSESLCIAQRLAESDPANSAWQRDLYVSFIRLGDLATTQGNLPEAQQLLSESLRIAQRLTRSDPANAAWQRDLSVSLNKLGDLATTQGNLTEARRHFGESHRILQQLAESDPTNAASLRDHSFSFKKLGDLAMTEGNLPEARQLLVECHRTMQHLAAVDPTNAAWQRDLWVSFIRLGDLAMTQENLPEAVRMFSESLDIAQRLAESDPTSIASQCDLAMSLARMGESLARSGDVRGGLLRVQEGRQITKSLRLQFPQNSECLTAHANITGAFFRIQSSRLQTRAIAFGIVAAMCWSGWKLGQFSYWLWPVSAALFLFAASFVCMLAAPLFTRFMARHSTRIHSLARRVNRHLNS